MMHYTTPRAVYSVHYTTDTVQGCMRFAAASLEAVRDYFARQYPGLRVDLIERFSLTA